MRFSRALAFLSVLAAPALALTDICASIDVDLFALLDIALVGGLIDVCLCVSLVPRELDVLRGYERIWTHP